MSATVCVDAVSAKSGGGSSNELFEGAEAVETIRGAGSLFSDEAISEAVLFAELAVVSKAVLVKEFTDTLAREFPTSVI